jgi:hypothetical protein
MHTFVKSTNVYFQCMYSTFDLLKVCQDQQKISPVEYWISYTFPGSVVDVNDRGHSCFIGGESFKESNYNHTSAQR